MEVTSDSDRSSSESIGTELLHGDPEHELLLTLVGTEERRTAQRERIGRLASAVDWARLERLLEEGRLFPSLGPRLATLTPPEATPAFAAALARARQAAGEDEIVLQVTAEQAHTALAARGIRSALLKGPLLGRAAYGEAGRRLSSDIDLLVAPEMLDEAAAALQELGYAAPTDHLETGGLPLLHLTMVHAENRLPPVELHWRIHWYEREFAHRHLLPAAADAPSDWRPRAEAEFAALLLFYARDGFIGLRYPSDLGSWWDRNGAEVSPAAFADLLRAYRPLQSALIAALAVAERTVGIPSRKLTGDCALGVRGNLAVRLADPYPYPTVQQVYAEIGLIDGLLAPRGKLRDYARRHIAPPPAVLREHAERAEEETISRFGYSARTMLRYVLALSRVAGLPLGAKTRFAR